jgi:hypothetical protein
MNAAASCQSVDAGVAAFVTTHWSVVLTAQGESATADEALGKLCRTYWWPLYGFVRRNGYTPEEAQDLTQGFFALFLEKCATWTLSAAKRGDYDLTYSFRSKIFWGKRDVLT